MIMLLGIGDFDRLDRAKNLAQKTGHLIGSAPDGAAVAQDAAPVQAGQRDDAEQQQEDDLGDAQVDFVIGVPIKKRL